MKQTTPATSSIAATNTAPAKTGHIHIDRITVNGPLEHEPLGELFYYIDEQFGLMAAGASAYTPKRRKNPLPDDLYIKSSSVQDNKLAYRLLFDCCPPQILQGHNFFGHSDLLDYVYSIFDQQLIKHGLTATPDERKLWRTGKLISLSQIHLTGNFWMPRDLKMKFLDAIDEANRSGKHRDIASCITLGFAETRRSTHQVACIYDKHPLLLKQWKKPGVYQAQLLEFADGSIRIEIRLYVDGLARRKLKNVAAWADVDVDALFFEVLGGFNVGNAIQPLLTAHEQKELSKTELVTYILWLLKQDLSSLLSPSTVNRHQRAILKTTGIDISGHRRPERLPELDLSEILTPANLVPIPDWAYESGRYWAPGQRG
jgi:hypothetical protein